MSDDLGKLPLTLNSIKRSQLEAFEKENIKSFCSTGFSDNKTNHCAHFVSHVFGYKFGLICGNMKLATKGKGFSLRVNEIFNSMPVRGDWSERPAHLDPCLIIVTKNKNITKESKPVSIGDMKWKHIGIFAGGDVWHYANSKDYVIKQSEKAFHATFNKVYGNDVSFFYARRTQTIAETSSAPTNSNSSPSGANDLPSHLQSFLEGPDRYVRWLLER